MTSRPNDTSPSDARPPGSRDTTNRVLEFENVTFAYGHEFVVRDISLTIKRGEFVAITGPNGGGKSTLLELGLGLLQPSTGTIKVLGTAPRTLKERWRIGYVPQRPYSPADFPATVAEVVSAGRWSRLGVFRVPHAKDRRAVARAIAMTGVESIAGERIGELSGGQQQRVHLARALAAEPELLLLDEPMTGVDVEAQMQFRNVLDELRHTLALTVVLIAHEYGPLADLVQRLIVLAGSVRFDGPPPTHDMATHEHHGLETEYLSLWAESEAGESARDRPERRPKR